MNLKERFAGLLEPSQNTSILQRKRKRKVKKEKVFNESLENDDELFLHFQIENDSDSENTNNLNHREELVKTPCKKPNLEEPLFDSQQSLFSPNKSEFMILLSCDPAEFKNSRKDLSTSKFSEDCDVISNSSSTEDLFSSDPKQFQVQNISDDFNYSKFISDYDVNCNSNSADDLLHSISSSSKQKIKKYSSKELDYTKYIDNYENSNSSKDNICSTNISSYESIPATPETSNLKILNQSIQIIGNETNQKQFKQKPIVFKKGGLAEKYNKSWKQRNADSLLWSYGRDYNTDLEVHTIIIEKFAVLYGNIVAIIKFDDEIFEKHPNFMFLNERFQKFIVLDKIYEVYLGAPMSNDSGNIYFPGNYIKAVKSS